MKRILALITEFVSGDSPGGYWAAYWCGRDELYVAACTRTKCSGFGAMRMVRLWLENPDTADLVLGLFWGHVAAGDPADAR